MPTLGRAVSPDAQVTRRARCRSAKAALSAPAGGHQLPVHARCGAKCAARCRRSARTSAASTCAAVVREPVRGEADTRRHVSSPAAHGVQPGEPEATARSRRSTGGGRARHEGPQCDEPSGALHGASAARATLVRRSEPRGKPSPSAHGVRARCSRAAERVSERQRAEATADDLQRESPVRSGGDCALCGNSHRPAQRGAHEVSRQRQLAEASGIHRGNRSEAEIATDSPAAKRDASECVCTLVRQVTYPVIGTSITITGIVTIIASPDRTSRRQRQRTGIAIGGCRPHDGEHRERRARGHGEERLALCRHMA